MEVREYARTGIGAVTLFNTHFLGNFSDGESFTFTAVSTLPDVFNTTIGAVGITIVLTGYDENGEEVVNYLTLPYRTGCDVFPILEEGVVVGWLTLVSFFD